MDWITRNIALSEYPSSKTDLGQVDAIMNLDQYTPYRTDVHHKHLPLIDGRGNAPEEIVGVLYELDKLVQKGKVLVHCAAGASRSPFILALYLTWRYGLFFEDALALVARRRSRVLNIDPGLLAGKDDVLKLLNVVGSHKP